MLVPDEIVLKIYDSFIDAEDNELFLCSTNLVQYKWLKQNQINTETFINFAAQINSPRETCNTLKSTTTYCEIKCKTRGILLVTSNCGIIISYREMFGSESLQKVALLYLDTLDHFNG